MTSIEADGVLGSSAAGWVGRVGDEAGSADQAQRRALEGNVIRPYGAVVPVRTPLTRCGRERRALSPVIPSASTAASRGRTWNPCCRTLISGAS